MLFYLFGYWCVLCCIVVEEDYVGVVGFDFGEDVEEIGGWWVCVFLVDDFDVVCFCDVYELFGDVLFVCGVIVDYGGGFCV